MKQEQDEFEKLIKTVNPRLPATDDYDVITFSPRMHLFYILALPATIITSLFTNTSSFAVGIVFSLLFYFLYQVPRKQAASPTPTAVVRPVQPRKQAPSTPQRETAPDALMGTSATFTDHESKVWDSILDEFRDDNKK